jgi:hypothetical protein
MSPSRSYGGSHDKLLYSSTSLVLPLGPRCLASWPTCKSTPGSLPHLFA